MAQKGEFQPHGIVASRDALAVVAKVAGKAIVAVLSNNFGRQSDQRVLTKFLDQNGRSSALCGLR